MRTRTRIHPYVVPESALRLAAYCGERWLTESAAIGAAIEPYLDAGGRDNALILRRLDRIARVSAQHQRTLRSCRRLSRYSSHLWIGALAELTAEGEVVDRVSLKRYWTLPDLLAHLLPIFGDRFLDSITAQDVEHMKAALLDRGLSRKRVNNILNVLSKVLRYAEELEVISRVPRIKTLEVPSQKFDFFTFEEFERLVPASASEPEWHAAVLVAREGGLRLGEVLALEPGDIDLEIGTFTVMRTDWRGHVGAPKGGKARRIPLTTRAAAALKAVRHLKGKLVFCWEDGSAWTFTTMRAGIKRHRRGPASASRAITNRYLHLAPGELRKAIALLEH